MSSISLIHVNKSYGKDVVIEDLNLEIQDGSFTVLVGPSGCGKSTTLRMITGLETPTSGDVLLDGQRVNQVAPGKRDISMVFQNYALYPTMTVEENIEFGLINKKVPKEERARRIREVCEIVGLTEYLKRKPANLSGGPAAACCPGPGHGKGPQGLYDGRAPVQSGRQTAGADAGGAHQYAPAHGNHLCVRHP